MLTQSQNLFFVLTLLISTPLMATNLTLDQVLAAPANPLTLNATLQTNSASQQITKTGGGQITLQGQDGTIYTLTFPAGSIPYDLMITMTEIQNLQVNGTPFQSFGVQIYPDGLELIKPATLEIQTPRPLNPKTLSIVTSNNDGSLAHIPPLKDFKNQTVQLQLFHFSNYAASDEEKIQEIIDLGMADQEYTRISNWMSQQIRIQKLSGNVEYDKLFLQSLQDAVKKYVIPRLQSAKTCSGGNDALSGYYLIARQAALMSVDMDEVLGTNEQQAFLDAIAITKSLCLQEARQLCHGEHNIPAAIKIWLSLSRFAALLGDNDLTVAIESAAQKCMNFKFFMQTDFKMGEDALNLHGLVAVSEFDFSFTIGGTLVTATGFLNAQGITEPLHDFQAGTITIVDTYLNLDTMVCNRISMNATPGPIMIDNFVGDLLAGRQPVLRLVDPNPEVNARFLCHDVNDPKTEFPMDLPPYGSEKYFLGIFHATHGETGLNEMNKEGYFDLKNAVFQNAPKYAEAVYNHIVDGVIHEVTTIVIHHTPED